MLLDPCSKKCAPYLTIKTSKIQHGRHSLKIVDFVIIETGSVIFIMLKAAGKINYDC